MPGLSNSLMRKIQWDKVTRINQPQDFVRRVYVQDFRSPSFPRQRESNNPLQRLDTRFHGYDDKRFISESPESFHTVRH